MDEKKKDMGDEVSTVNTSQSSPEKEENHNHCCGCCLKKNSVNVDGSSSSSLESNQPGCYQCVPIGWKFKPSDLDILSYYLPRKVSNQPMQYNTIKEVKLYHKVPSEIMDEYKDEEVDGEWYFFTKRERRYPKGVRPRRDVGGGLGKWKISGDAQGIDKANKQIGVRRTLEYYRGPGNPIASNKTNIRMDEYILETETEKRDEELANDDPSRAQKRKKFHEWALCRIRKVAEVANPEPKPDIQPADTSEENIEDKKIDKSTLDLNQEYIPEETEDN